MCVIFLNILNLVLLNSSVVIHVKLHDPNIHQTVYYKLYIIKKPCNTFEDVLYFIAITNVKYYTIFTGKNIILIRISKCIIS